MCTYIHSLLCSIFIISDVRVTILCSYNIMYVVSIKTFCDNNFLNVSQVTYIYLRTIIECDYIIMSSWDMNRGSSVATLAARKHSIQHTAACKSSSSISCNEFSWVNKKRETVCVYVTIIIVCMVCIGTCTSAIDESRAANSSFSLECPSSDDLLRAENGLLYSWFSCENSPGHTPCGLYSLVS